MKLNSVKAMLIFLERLIMMIGFFIVDRSLLAQKTGRPNRFGRPVFIFLPLTTSYEKKKENPNILSKRSRPRLYDWIIRIKPTLTTVSS